MREILFRGKASHPLNKNKWFYGSYFEKIEYGIGTAPLKKSTLIVSVPERNSGIGIVDIDKSTVGEYTGVTDKKNVKIFEGDIVHVNCCYESPLEFVGYEFLEFDAVVIFEMNHFWLADNPNNPRCLFFDVENTCMEVIGNIHDDPDLLGGDDE